MDKDKLALKSPGLLKYLRVKLSQDQISELEKLYDYLAGIDDLEELQMPLRASNDFNPRAARLLNILFTDYESADFETFKLAILSCQASKKNSEIQELLNFEEGMIVPDEDSLIAIALARLLDNIRHLHLHERKPEDISLTEAKFLSLKLLLEKRAEFSKLLIKTESSLKAQKKRVG